MKLPKGTHILPEKIENFNEVCKELGSDFDGAMRMRGEIGGDVLFADLLIEGGSIIATSLKRKSDGNITKKENALQDIQELFAGSSGKLDLFSFASEEMERAIENSADYLLAIDANVVDLGIKLRSKIVKPKKKHSFLRKISSIFSKMSKGMKEDRLNELRGRISKGDEMTDMEIRPEIRERPATTPAETDEISYTKAKRFAEIKGKRQTLIKSMDELGMGASDAGGQAIASGAKKPHTIVPNGGIIRKQSRLQEIKERRLARLSKLTEKVEEKKQAPKDGSKIETNIDKLLALVKEKGAIKLNDTLSNSLKVSKTQVEEWAMILEEHNLVELHYPAIGEPEIRRLKEG